MVESDGTSPFLFVGNALWLDFVNTEAAVNGNMVDLLASATDLRTWLIQSGTAGAGDGMAERDAERLLGRARELRVSLRQMAEQMAQSVPVSEEAVEAINRLLRLRHGTTQIVWSENGWQEKFIVRSESADAVLVPVAQSAASLLVHGDQSLVRKCEGPDCVLYFYDTSKNHKRRWCSMAGCGNRHKAAAHYQRIRQVATS